MVEIKPDEISAILRQQLSNFNAGANLEEIGTVLQIGDGIARVYGLKNVRSGELVEFDNGVKAIALNLEEDNVGVVLMGDSGEIREGDVHGGDLRPREMEGGKHPRAGFRGVGKNAAQRAMGLAEHAALRRATGGVATILHGTGRGLGGIRFARPCHRDRA